jgi:hypothetical protein
MVIKEGRIYVYKNSKDMNTIRVVDVSDYIGYSYIGLDFYPLIIHHITPVDFYLNFLPFYTKILITRLSKKLYPNAIEEDGCLILERK